MRTENALMLVTKSKKRRILDGVIDKELAEEILRTRREEQRKVKEKHVMRLANVMMQNKWINLNGDTIKFDTNGNLIDGQHRLLAVISSGKKIHTYIALGCEPDDIYFIDTWQKTRSMGDVFQMKGECNAVAMAAATNYLWRCDNGVLLNRKIYPDPEECYKYFLANQEMANSYHFARPANQFLGTGMGTFLHYLFSQINKAEANKFFEDLATGASIPSGDPVLLLRNRLMYNRRKDVQMKLDTNGIIAICILAWNYRRNKRLIKTLRWTAKEFPRAI